MRASQVLDGGTTWELRNASPSVDPPPSTATPICDALLSLKALDIESFHALPVSRARSLWGSHFRGRYDQLFGESALSLELTYTGDLFDTPAIPSRCIERSRELTAAAFGARYSTYVTSGTTASNSAAVAALCRPGHRVLADRLCHQSIHFALVRSRARVTLARSSPREGRSNRCALDVEALLDELRRARAQNDPYRVVVLTQCSYEGVFYELDALLREFLVIDPLVRCIVDEAWFAHAHFHPYYRRYSAMHAAGELGSTHPALAVVATQSAHKTLSALRQGSYMHVHGDDQVVRVVKDAQFTYHTTSPSYPILASLELARAQAVAEGEALVGRALDLAGRIRRAFHEDPALSVYRVNESDELKSAYVRVDPARISIDVSSVTQDVRAFRAALFHEYGIFVNSITDTSLLLNVHIGITPASVDRLLEVFARCGTRRPRRQASRARAPERSRGAGRAGSSPMPVPGCVSGSYVIPYPPGVPAVAPGEVVTPQVASGVSRLLDAGVDVLSIDVSMLGGAAPTARGESDPWPP
jgi:arginine/lysine/ornithine decarboxylase